MACATFLRALIVTSLFVVVGVPAEPPQARKEATVWALPDSKLYHCPSSKLYKVGNGKEMSECQAIREGYKPALVGCGANCR